MSISLPNPRLLVSDIENNRAEWLELRKGKVSATKIGVIMGVNRWKSPLQLWAEETGKVCDDFAGNKATKLGLVLEPFVAQLLQEELGNGVQVQRCNALYQHSTIDFAIASPDAFVVLADGSSDLAELKTANHRAAADWSDGAAPDSYVLQLQWQLGVMGVNAGYLACMIGGDPSNFPHPYFEFDSDLWELMLEEAQTFIECIQRDIPPEPGAGDAKLIERIVDRNKSVRILPEAEQIEAETIIPMLLGARDKKKELQEVADMQADEVKRLENKLRLLLGDSTAANAAGYCFEVQSVNVAERISPPYSYTKLKLSKRK